MIDPPSPPEDGGVSDPDAGDVVPLSTELDRCLAAGGGFEEALSFDNNVLVAHGEIVAMTVSEGGQIALASTDGALKMWSVMGMRGGYDTAFREATPVVNAVVYGPDGSWLAAGGEDGRITIENAIGGPPRDELAMGTAPLVAVAVTADGSSVAAADTGVRVWTPADGAVTDPLPTALTGLHALEYLADGTLVTAGDVDGAPALELRSASDPATVTATWEHGGVLDSVRDLAVSPDGEHLVAVGPGFVAVFDPADVSTPQAFTEVAGHEAVGAAVDLENGHFATAGRDDTLRLFDLATATEQTRFDVPAPVGVGVEPGGRFVTGGTDGWIRVHECVAP